MPRNRAACVGDGVAKLNVARQAFATIVVMKESFPRARLLGYDDIFGCVYFNAHSEDAETIGKHFNCTVVGVPKIPEKLLRLI